MKALMLGFGAAVGLTWVYWLGERAIARERAACLTRRILRERRAIRWREFGQ